MSHAIEFVETSIFTRQIKELAIDDELKDLQAELIAQPDKGDIIKGTGGLRKVRMAVGNIRKEWQYTSAIRPCSGRQDLLGTRLSKSS